MAAQGTTARQDAGAEAASRNHLASALEDARQGPSASSLDAEPPSALLHEAQQNRRSDLEHVTPCPGCQLVTPKKLVSPEDRTPRIVSAQPSRVVSNRSDGVNKVVDSSRDQPSSSKPRPEQETSAETIPSQPPYRPAEQALARHQLTSWVPQSSGPATGGSGLSSLVKSPLTEKSFSSANSAFLLGLMHSVIPPGGTKTANSAIPPAVSLAEQRKHASYTTAPFAGKGWPIPSSLSGPSVIAATGKSAARKASGEAVVLLQPDENPLPAFSLPPGTWAVPGHVKNVAAAQVATRIW